MRRVLGHIVPREVIVVATSEMFFSGISIYLALWITTSVGATQKIATSSSLALVFALIVCFAITAGILGLYRARAIAEFHSLVAKGLLAGLLGLLTIAVLPRLFHPGAEIVTGGAPLTVLAVPLAWLGCLIATQAAFSVAIQHHLLSRRILIVAYPDQVARFESFIAAGTCRRFEELRLVNAGDGGGASALRRTYCAASGSGPSLSPPAMTAFCRRACFSTCACAVSAFSARPPSGNTRGAGSMSTAPTSVGCLTRKGFATGASPTWRSAYSTCC